MYMLDICCLPLSVNAIMYINNITSLSIPAMNKIGLFKDKKVFCS